MMSDLILVGRRLKQRPAFLAAALLMLSLGIGANTAVFSVVDALLLRPLPVRQPDQLVVLYRTVRQNDSLNRFSFPRGSDARRFGPTLLAAGAV